MVRLCVCLCVGHDREPSKNGRTDRDAVGEEHAWDQGTIRYIGRTSAPPGEYDGSICLVAAVRLSLPLL